MFAPGKIETRFLLQTYWEYQHSEERVSIYQAFPVTAPFATMQVTPMSLSKCQESLLDCKVLANPFVLDFEREKPIIRNGESQRILVKGPRDCNSGNRFRELWIHVPNKAGKVGVSTKHAGLIVTRQWSLDGETWAGEQGHANNWGRYVCSKRPISCEFLMVNSSF